MPRSSLPPETYEEFAKTLAGHKAVDRFHLVDENDNDLLPHQQRDVLEKVGGKALQNHDGVPVVVLEPATYGRRHEARRKMVDTVIASVIRD